MIPANEKNTLEVRLICDTWAKLRKKAPERRHLRLYCWLWTNFTYCSNVFIVHFEQVNVDRVQILHLPNVSNYPFTQLSLWMKIKITAQFGRSTDFLSNHFPVDTGHKLNVHKTYRTSSARLMYVQFTSGVRGWRRNLLKFLNEIWVRREIGARIETIDPKNNE